MRSLLCVSKGSPSARDVRRPDPLRRLVAPSVHVRRPVRAGEARGRRRARRPAEDAGGPAGRRAAPPCRLGAAGPVLGDGVRLGHEPAEEACGVAQPRRPLDGRVSAPDVAVGRLARDVVPARGLPELEPVPERPLLPFLVARERARRSRCARRSGSPSSPTCKGRRSASGAASRRATRRS